MNAGAKRVPVDVGHGRRGRTAVERRRQCRERAAATSAEPRRRGAASVPVSVAGHAAVRPQAPGQGRGGQAPRAPLLRPARPGRRWPRRSWPGRGCRRPATEENSTNARAAGRGSARAGAGRRRPWRAGRRRAAPGSGPSSDAVVAGRRRRARRRSAECSAGMPGQQRGQRLPVGDVAGGAVARAPSAASSATSSAGAGRVRPAPADQHQCRRTPAGPATGRLPAQRAGAAGDEHRAARSASGRRRAARGRSRGRGAAPAPAVPQGQLPLAGSTAGDLVVVTRCPSVSRTGAEVLRRHGSAQCPRHGRQAAPALRVAQAARRRRRDHPQRGVGVGQAAPRCHGAGPADGAQRRPRVRVTQRGSLHARRSPRPCRAAVPRSSAAGASSDSTPESGRRRAEPGVRRTPPSAPRGPRRRRQRGVDEFRGRGRAERAVQRCPRRARWPPATPRAPPRACRRRSPADPVARSRRPPTVLPFPAPLRQGGQHAAQQPSPASGPRGYGDTGQVLRLHRGRTQTSVASAGRAGRPRYARRWVASSQ